MKQYLDMLQYILDNGSHHNDRTGVGTTRVFGHMVKFDLREGFPLVTTKKMFLRGLLEELRWFIRGSTDAEELQDKNVHIWDAWSNEDGDIGPGYGFQWRNFGALYQGCKRDTNHTKLVSHDVQGNLIVKQVYKGEDQLKYIVDSCMERSTSRRLILSAWNPVDIPNMNLPPCHVLYHFSVDGDILHLNMYQRSADVFLGVPFNIAESAVLMSLIAHVTGMKPGIFTHMFGDLHIYDNHHEQVKIQLSREPRELPKINLNDRLKNKGFDGLLDFVVDDLELIGYNPYPKIKADVAI